MVPVSSSFDSKLSLQFIFFYRKVSLMCLVIRFIPIDLILSKLLCNGSSDNSMDDISIVNRWR